jgi:prepilin-type N-terminal cleavage/methylation domain-containing protein
MTRTSRAGSLSKASKWGFTLLELLAVLFIISIFFTLAVPKIRGGKGVDSRAMRLASVLRELNDSAMARKEAYDITFELDKQMAHWKGPEGKKELDLSGLDYVSVPSRGKVREGSLQIFFGPEGASEDITARLLSKDAAYTVYLNEMSGRVRVDEEEVK